MGFRNWGGGINTLYDECGTKLFIYDSNDGKKKKYLHEILFLMVRGIKNECDLTLFAKVILSALKD